MVWAGVSLHHKTNIVFINGNLTAAHYQHEVLETAVIPLLRNHRRMQLLHDGALAHRARSTTAYLNANNVKAVDFPPKSPDLNIIENILDELNSRMRRTGPEVIKLEFIVKLKIKRQDWLLADMCPQVANHCPLF